MNNSRATENYTNHLHHQNALLQLLQLQQYRELCYQMYLVGLALADRNLTYEYDKLYNLSSRTDSFLGITSIYQYDVLNRIEHAHFDYTKTPVAGLDDLHYSYDAYGNLTYKDGQGDYHYTDTQHPNRLVSTDQRGFLYDENGNMTRNGNTQLEYNAANKVTAITTDEGTTTFAYDMNDHRYRKTTDESTTTYIDKVYEHIEYHDYGFTEDRYYVYAGDKVIAVSSQYHGRRYENETRYLHHDALGSVDTITNSQGEVVEQSIYKPFGEHLRLYTKPDSRSITNRGYTGHEEIEGTSLVHMNARVYDPTLGRFMSADTLIQDPYDMQTYNRYSYVRNNPLKYTDPSGHSFLSIITGILIGVVSFGIGTAVVGALGLSGVGAAIVGGAVMGFTGGFLGGLMVGLSPGDALMAGLKGGIFGAIGGAMSYQIAEYISVSFGLDGHSISLFTAAKKGVGYAAVLTKSVLHGIVRGTLNTIQNGGKFLSSFASAFVSSAFSIGKKTFGEGAVAARTAVMALVGGVTSSLTGGKFLNGAVSAAFVHLFNAEKVGRYFLSKPEAHNGGKTHVHWGKSSNKRMNAINTDGTVRHGVKPPNKVKSFIKKTFKMFNKMPSLYLLVPAPVLDNYLNRKPEMM